MNFWWRLRKKVLKRWARNAFFPSWRVRLLRACGYRIGSDVYIADELIIVEELAERGNIVIGDRASFAPRVTLVTSSHPNQSRIAAVAPVARGPITIEHDAWIGAGAIILPGVRIGAGAVVGANSVVTSDVNPLEVVAGQPARVVRTLSAPPGWV
ncbi:MAG TPA: DapH/DapD/GlmU-related protein [Gemmatimonadales bacterium]|nr:DapH/DapD/GlmU-related protein [Gemmatimonadales bacterium]